MATSAAATSRIRAARGRAIADTAARRPEHARSPGPWSASGRLASTRIVDLLCCGWGREPLDESPRNIGLDDHAAIGREMADHARHAVEAGDLLAVEFLAT